MKKKVLKTGVLMAFRVVLASCPLEIAGAGTYLELLAQDILSGRRGRLR